MTNSSTEEEKVYRKPTEIIRDSHFIAAALLIAVTKLTETECKLKGTVTDAGYDEIYRRHLMDVLKASILLGKFDAEQFNNSRAFIRKMGIRFDLVTL